MTPRATDSADAVQQFGSPLTAHAVFLVLSVRDGDEATATVRDVVADLPGLVKTVRFRDSADSLTCTVAIGHRRWSGLTGLPTPPLLRPFAPIAGARHTAVATPGDLLLHIRADRADLCFELERLVLARLRDAVVVEDETSGFRYFDRRDLLGFVDGTANPVGADIEEAAVVTGTGDPRLDGGSHVVVQKYLHPIERWNALPTEVQEAIIGRTKADNVELDDAEAGQKAHKTLATIVDADGVEHDIVRDNMPFGRPGSAEFGTYFIGYANDPGVIRTMLERMFVGDPPGLHDRLLDFSKAVTGTAFFAPSAATLGALPFGPAGDTAPAIPTP